MKKGIFFSRVTDHRARQEELRAFRHQARHLLGARQAR
jgi:hypothetical protein